MKKNTNQYMYIDTEMQSVNKNGKLVRSIQMDNISDIVLSSESIQSFNDKLDELADLIKKSIIK